MLLSAQIIVKNLNAFVPAAESASLPATLTLGRPVFLRSQDAWPAGHVCICETLPETLPRQALPENTLVFFHKDTNFLRVLHSANLIRIPDSASVIDLFNKIQEIFDRYDRWDEQLKDFLRKGNNLTSMLDCSFPVFGNPVLVQASDFSLLAHSSVIDENAALHHLIDPAVGFETASAEKLDPEYRELQNKKEPFLMPSYYTGSRQLCVNLYEHGVFSCRVMLSEEMAPLSSEQAALLAHLSEYLQAVLQRNEEAHSGSGHSLGKILEDIIMERLTDYTAIDNRLSEYGWFSSHYYCCLSLTRSVDREEGLSGNYLCHYLEEMIKGSCAFPYGDDILVFVNLSRYDRTIDQLLTALTPFLRDSLLKTGASSTIRGTIDLRYSCLQARTAQEIGNKYENYRWVHRFEDISLTYLCDCCIRDMPSHMVVSQKLLTLHRYDEKHHSDYCDTLRTYLESEKNAVQSARKLFIHRSTFLYRLDRIQEIVPIDFNNEDELFYLLLSFRILDLKEKEMTQVTYI